MFENYPDLLTTKDIQSILGYSYATVRNMCATGKLPTMKLGGRFFVPKPKLEELVNKSINMPEGD